MTRTVEERFNDLLTAIGRARVADRRLRLADSLGDEEGVQIAFDAFLHNLSVIGEAVRTLPPSILERDANTPWEDVAALRDVIGHGSHRIDPTMIHATVEGDLGPLEKAVKRLR